MLPPEKISFLIKVKWLAITILILGGTLFSVVTDREWPPFSPYPMYASPVWSDELRIYRVVTTDMSDIELQKKILSINTTRTITSLVSSRVARRSPRQEIAESILNYYDAKIRSDEKFKDRVFKLRLERVVYSYVELKMKIDEIAKAQTWGEMDQILTPRRKIVYER